MAVIDPFVYSGQIPRYWQGQYGPAIKRKVSIMANNDPFSLVAAKPRCYQGYFSHNDRLAVIARY